MFANNMHFVFRKQAECLFHREYTFKYFSQVEQVLLRRAAAFESVAKWSRRYREYGQMERILVDSAHTRVGDQQILFSAHILNTSDPAIVLSTLTAST